MVSEIFFPEYKFVKIRFMTDFTLRFFVLEFDPSWGEPIELFLIPASAPRLSFRQI